LWASAIDAPVRRTKTMNLESAANEFLQCRRIAVAGVSRNGDTAGNHVYRKLRKAGYHVFAVNPNSDELEGDPCYHDVAAIPGGVEAVVICTAPSAAESVVRHAHQAGAKWVWMHRSLGQGSVDATAVKTALALGLNIIPGSCPMMFCTPVDLPHRCLRWFLRVTGRQASPQPACEALRQRSS
jgi:predicted CoA-binding protein